MSAPEPIAVPALAALLTHRATNDLVALLQATPDDKLAWTPENTGRSVLEQAKECAIVHYIWAVIIRERGLPIEMPPEFTAFAEQAINSRESAIAALQTTTNALVAAIQSVAPEETGVAVRVDMMSDRKVALAECCLYPYWHTVYHEGQVNYLQTLYGDTKDRHKYHMDGEGEPAAS